MHTELLESAAATSKENEFPWGTVLSVTGLAAWSSFELYKRRKSILNFGHYALKWDR